MDAELNEHGLPEGWPDKPLHEYTAAESRRYFFPALVEHVTQGRIRASDMRLPPAGR